MRAMIEKIRRKTYEAFYKAGILSARAIQIAPQGVAGHMALSFRFYPYHFIVPAEICSDFTFDKNAVPIQFSRHNTGTDINLLCPAYWGLLHANQYEAGYDQENAKAETLRMCAFLLDHGRNDSGLFFDYTYPHPKLSLGVPWISGLTQALATSLFLRAYMLTSDHHYLNAAQQSARVLLIPVSQGGVLNELDGKPWIEEYPGTPATHVLNGCLFGLIALMELSTFDSSVNPPTLTLQESVAMSFPRFQAGQFLYYDLLRRQFCNPHYMGLHTLLMYHIAQTAGGSQFQYYVSALNATTDWILYMDSIHHHGSSSDNHWITAHLK